MQDHDHARDHDEQVDEAAPDVDDEETQQPQDQQNGSDGKQHRELRCPVVHGRRPE